jgi:hypothetical protein
MDKGLRKWLLLAMIIIVAIVAAFGATSLPVFRYFFQGPFLPPYFIKGDLVFFYTAKTVVNSVNVALLIFLLISYVSIYRKTRSDFTAGLIVFSIVLLMYALSSNPFVIEAFGFRIIGLGPFALLPDVFMFAALIVLLYLSLKY